MQFVTVRDLRINPGKIWEKLGQGKEVIITSNGKPIAILAGTNEENLEKSLATLRQARALQTLAEMHQATVAAGADRISEREIEREIRAARRKRSR
jgi:prevent-host-death family protein